jgi:hypothetical protein
VGIEGVILKHHGHIPVFGRDLVDHPVADADGSLRDLLQSGHHAQGGGFGAPRWSHQDDEFTILDGEVDAMDHLHRAVTFDDFFENYLCHIVLLINRW